MKLLTITGGLRLPNKPMVLQVLGTLTVQHGLAGMSFEQVEDTVLLSMGTQAIPAGEEHTLLSFMVEVGRILPRVVTGAFEVWWPECTEAGPQWWELDADGKVYVTESEIVRGERKPYEA